MSQYAWLMPCAVRADAKLTAEAAVAKREQPGVDAEAELDASGEFAAERAAAAAECAVVAAKIDTKAAEAKQSKRKRGKCPAGIVASPSTSSTVPIKEAASSPKLLCGVFKKGKLGKM